MNGIKEFSHRSIEVNGGSVSFIDGGSGPTLFLMHGIGGNSRSVSYTHLTLPTKVEV